MLSVRCLSVCLSCLSCLSVCDVGVLWPIGWTDQDESWHAGRPRPWPHCVRWGLTFSSPKGAQSPQFSAHACCGQTAAWIKMPLGTTVDLGPYDIVLDGDPAPPSPKGGRAPPQFSAHVYCGQTAGWIKVALGMEMGLGPGHIVLDGDTAPLSQKEAQPPILAHVYCGQTAGWIKTPLGTEVDLGPGHFVLDWFLAIGERGTAAPPLFSAHAYCGYGRPSQLLLSSCTKCRPKIGHYLAKLWARLQWLPFLTPSVHRMT